METENFGLIRVYSLRDSAMASRAAIIEPTDTLMADVPSAPVVVQRSSKQVIRWLAAVIALGAAWVSYDLLLKSLGSAATSPLLATLCHDAAGDACASVLSTPWGSWPISDRAGSPRIPVAAFGVGYFLCVAAWFVFVGIPTRSRAAWFAPILILLLVGTVNSLQLTLVMANTLQRWCSGCMIVHGLNGLLLILALSAVPWRKRSTGSTYPTHGHAAAALTAGALLIAAAPTFVLLRVFNNQRVAVEREYKGLIEDPAFARWRYGNQPIADVELGDGVSLMGNENAPHTVIAFVDLQCPRCRELQKALDALLAEMPSRLRVGYRHFPLDTSCNEQAKRTMHQHACAAARAVEAARATGGNAAAEKLRHAIHAATGPLNDDALTRFAADAGISRNAFDAALNSPAVDSSLKSDIALAAKLGLSGAPHVYLNGRKFEFWTNAETWKALLATEPENR